MDCFKLERNYYALDSDLISTIALLPEQVIPMPNTPKFVRGIYNLRGKVIPIIELRYLFELPSLEDGYRDFVEMIDRRKQDHLNWIASLEQSLAAGTRFELARDPRLCAFGQWLYSYEPENATVKLHLNRLFEPHEKLHDAVRETEECNKDCAHCTRETCLKNVLANTRELVVPEVLRLLEETKEVMRSTYREMMLVLEMCGSTFALIVDGVAAVESLEPLNVEGGLDQLAMSKYIVGVGRGVTVPQDVLQLDDHALFQSINRQVGKRAVSV